MSSLYAGQAGFGYCQAYLLGTRDVPAEVRRAAEAAIAGRRVLVVQNIADGQGDEIIRVVPLLEALLAYNPRLEVVLITARVYLYTHPRLRLVPIDDHARTRAALDERFDGVIDFFEPVVPEVNYDLELEARLQAYVRARAPWLYAASWKGWNHFVHQRLELESRPYAKSLGLDRQRVANIYETTFRLLAELGLPLRLGEQPPPERSVLAGLPWPEAEAAWSSVVQGNLGRRPVALVCPFGGTEPLKGYVERQGQAPSAGSGQGLAGQLRRLIAEGYYLVLVPNGLAWGSAAQARRIVARLGPDEQAEVAIAPDPADGSGQVSYEYVGRHTVPYASYVMRQITYFVRFADLVVTIEGWMMHAAYCLGKRYRVLMLPYSHPAEWHPYGRTRHQDVDQDLRASRPRGSLSDPDGPPLPE